jgi:hypothetical protein
VGRAKRRHILRYLAARERAGIVGTGPFDLDEALVKLDARMTAGCRWALAVAVELALTKQRPECSHCRGAGSFVRGQMTYLDTGVRPCAQCRGSGRNTRATLPWPAWLRRKGQTVHDLRTVASGSGWRWSALMGWTPLGEHRLEREARSFPRGAHIAHDPWWDAYRRDGASFEHVPRSLRGAQRHAEQRRERTERLRIAHAGGRRLVDAVRENAGPSTPHDEGEA